MEDTQKLQSNEHIKFNWEDLKNISKGRESLGEEMPVLIYRLMQYTMLDVLSKAYGAKEANGYFREAGFLAGVEFSKNCLNLNTATNIFFADLQKKLRELKMGILKIELFDEDTGEIVLTISEDLDCSGIPIKNGTVCYYDEGFLSGILETFTGKKYDVKEIDCWATGNRTCRFQAITY